MTGNEVEFLVCLSATGDIVENMLFLGWLSVAKSCWRMLLEVFGDIMPALMSGLGKGPGIIIEECPNLLR